MVAMVTTDKPLKPKPTTRWRYHSKEEHKFLEELFYSLIPSPLNHVLSPNKLNTLVQSGTVGCLCYVPARYIVSLLIEQLRYMFNVGQQKLTCCAYRAQYTA